MKINKLFLLLLPLLLLASASAAPLSTHTYDPVTKTAIVKDYLGLTTVATIQLLENTNQCLISCSAILQIIPATDLTSVKSTADYNFLLFNALGKETSIKQFKIYQQINESYTEDVTDYKDCSYTDTKNNTWIEKQCPVGSHKETRINSTWQETSLDKLAFKAGQPVIIKLAAQKAPTENIDWQPVFYGEQIKEMQWFNASWGYTKPIIYSQAIGTTQANYQIPINVTFVAAKMNADFSDLRFTMADNTTEYSYWIEQQVASTWAYVWVKVNVMNTTNQTLQMWYGNPTATTTSNGYAAMDFFDNFPNTALNTTGWAKDAGTVSVSGGVLTLSSSTILHSKYFFNITGYLNDGVLMTNVSMSALNGNNGRYFGLSEPTQNIGSRSYIAYRYGTDYHNFISRTTDPTASYDTYVILTNYTNVYHVYEIRWQNATNATFLVDHVAVASHTTNIPDATQVPVKAGFRTIADSNATISMTWVAFRKFSGTAPLVYIGAEQSQIGPSIIITQNLPTNNTEFDNNQLVNFNFTATSNTNTTFNCSLMLDSAVNTTTNGVSNATLTNFAVNGVAYTNHTWYVNCTDSAATNSSSSLKFFVNDTQSPTWSSNWASTPSVYAATPSQFNITWADAQQTISTVVLESNFTGSAANYSMNLVSGYYNFSRILPAGYFYWKSYANDTSNNWNSSDTWTFTISQAANPTNVYIDTNLNQNLSKSYTNTTTNLTGTTTVGAVTLLLNGSSVSNPDIQYLAASFYNVTVQGAGNTNYSANSTTYWLTITQALSSMAVYLNDTNGNATFPLLATVNMSAILNITGKAITLNSTIPGFVNLSGTTPQANTSTYLNTSGVYEVSGYFLGDTNYSAASQTFYANITAPPVITIVTPANTTYYVNNTWFNITTDKAASWCGFSSNGNANASMLPVTTTEWFNYLPSMADGFYNVTYYCNDSVGSMGTSGARYYTINTTGPQITLNLPANAAQFDDNQNINFNFTATSVSNATLSCGIWLDAALNQTNASVLNGTLTNFLINGIAYGPHLWYLNCTDNIYNITSSRIFTIVNSTPAITILSPINITYNSATVNLDALISTNGTALSSVWYSVDGGANTSVSNNWTYQETASGYACSAGGTWEYPCVNTYDFNWSSSGYSMPTEVAIVYINYSIPTYGSNNSLWQVKDIAYANLSIPSDCWNSPLQFKAVSSYITYGANNVQWSCYNGSAWNVLRNTTTDRNIYEEAMYWSGNGSYTNASAISTTIPGLSDGSHNVTVYANSTTNQFNSAQRYFSIDATNPNATLGVPNGAISNTATSLDFFCSATDNVGLANTTLWTNYYGTWQAYSTYSTTGTSNSSNYTMAVTTPLNFLWNCQVCDAANNCVFAPANNSVYTAQVTIGNTSCGAGYTAAQNYTFQTEDNLTAVTGANAAINIQFGPGSNNTLNTLNTSVSNTDWFAICVNASLPSYYVGYGEIQYSKTGYANRRYYLFTNSTLTSSTLNTTLYLLTTALANPFQFTFTDQALNVYAGDYSRLLRWYPDLSSYNVVDAGKTDGNGQTIMYVALNTVDYRVALYYPNGTLIKLADPSRFSCSVLPCTYSMRVASVGNYLTDFNIQHSLTYTPSTKMFSFTWNDPSGTTQSMQLVVDKMAGDVDVPVCNSTMAAATGALSCNISAYSSGTFTAVAYKTASPSTPLETLMQTIASTLFTGQMGLFISFILMILMIFMGLYSPIAALIMGIASLIPAVVLGAITPVIFISISVLAVLIIHTMKKVS